MKKIYLFLTALFLFASCATVKEPEVFVQPDYTAADSINAEIKRIDELLNDNAVKALWRSMLLKESVGSSLAEQNNELFSRIENQLSECLEKNAEECNNSFEEKKYLDSYRIYTSLKNCGYSKLNEFNFTQEELVSLFTKDVPGLNALTEQQSEQNENVKVSEFIKGTVTVLVDKGIKIEKGMGFTDGVLGSGFFISKDGYIVTNHHVISDCVDPSYEGYSRLYIKLAEDTDTRIPAKVIGWDKTLDLALLKAEVEAPYVFKLGSSDQLDVGTKVYAIGSPLGLERTLTSGIISAKDRKLFTVGDVFQVDTPVNSGNSGGPLIDENGSVQAIVFAGVQNFQGLNFAIPVEYFKYELPFLYNGGERKQPWINAYGKTKRLPGAGAVNEGITVHYVMPGGSASRAGIKNDFTVTAFDSNPITCIEELHKEFMQIQPDGIHLITAADEYGNESQKLVYLEKRPVSPGYEIYRHDVVALSMIPILGMELVPVSTTSKRKYTVVKVIKGSSADESGFSEHDPVDVQKIQFNDDHSAAYIQLFTKKRKSGYMDVNLALQASMDNPFYF